MALIQIELDEEEDEVVRTYMWVLGEDNKKLALKRLIRDFKKTPKIEKAIKLKREISKNE